MKKIIILLAIATLAIATQAQKATILKEPTDIKFRIADERVKAIRKVIESQITNQFISDKLVFADETNKFLDDLDSVLLVYKYSISETDTIEIDTARLKQEQDSIWLKLSQAETYYVISNSTEYERLLVRIKELEKLLQTSIILPDYAEWVQPLGAHDAYSKGDIVLFNGKLYESTMDNNVWAPNITGWREKTK